MSNVETFFLITVNEDGTFTSYAELPEEKLEAGHTATNYDIYQACKQIVQEFETQILSDRVARTVLGALIPQVETPTDKIKDKLKERGINPESAAPTE